MGIKSVLILGGGESGVSAALLAQKKRYQVCLSEGKSLKPAHRKALIEQGIDFEENGHNFIQDKTYDTVVKSPGISSESEVVKRILSNNIKVISEIEFAYQHCPGKIIAVTGSNGKSTTVSLIHHILIKAGKKAALCGNIGVAFSRVLCQEDFEYYVVEVSSFQLEDIEHFKPYIAILLNITPDHLDRYKGDVLLYANAKMQIAVNQTEEDFFIYNQDDQLLDSLVAKSGIKSQRLPITIEQSVLNGAYLEADTIIINYQNQFTMSIHDLALQGKHNVYNSMASSIATRILELRKDIIRESLSDFENMEHRMEFVANVHGVEFVNDSKATNVNSTWYALESYDKPIVWIVGGQDKGNDYTMLSEIVKSKVKAIVCLGKDNSKIIEAFKDVVEDIVECEEITKAVSFAYSKSQKGDVVLLSPANASFDLFENFEDRGRQFKEAVRSM